MDKKQIGCKMAERWESCKLTAYNDGADVITIGRGTTIYPSGPKKGKPVSHNDTCTQEQADEWFYLHFEKEVFPYVEKLHKKYDFPDLVYAALCSFTYNAGCGTLNKSELVECYARQDWGSYDPKTRVASGLAAELLKIVNSYDPKLKKKAPSKGLINRRTYEVQVMLGQITV